MFFQKINFDETKITELISQRFFNIPVRNYPHDGANNKYYLRNQGIIKCRRNRDDIKDQGCHTLLFLLLHCLCQVFCKGVMLHNGFLKNVIRYAAQQKIYGIKSNRQLFEMIFTHPAASERYQRKPEEQVHIAPDNISVYMMNRVKQVMVITPVNADKNETPQVTHKDRPQCQ